MARCRGFVLVEAVTILVIALVFCAVLAPAMHRRSQMSSLDLSRNNVRQIIAAQWAYRNDAADQPPMRGGRYQNGTMSSWDSWNFGGKNCDIFWLTAFNGNYDESAYARPLNPYLTTKSIPVPSGYQNTGAGVTWTFNDGTPTPQQRLSLQVPVFRSPGDVATRERSWPNPTPGVSGYDDLGTSYQLNMVWWNQTGFPSGFTAHYEEGTRRIKNQGHIIEPQMYVWINDQIGGVVPVSPAMSFPGEFGGTNKSVLGFLDGRAEYIQLTPGATSGPGYRFTLY